MSNKMLIDATHPEETRVVVLRGNRVEEFDFEAADRQQLRGNIYLAKVTRVEPSLQAAFVDYGGNRHGFLAFSEIHPDYYQIPYADRQALLQEHAREEEEEEAAEAAAEERRAERGGGGGSDEPSAGDDDFGGRDTADPESEPPRPEGEVGGDEPEQAAALHRFAYDEVSEPAPSEAMEPEGEPQSGDTDSDFSRPVTSTEEEGTEAGEQSARSASDEQGELAPEMASQDESEAVHADASDNSPGELDHEHDHGPEEVESNGAEHVESVGAEDALEEVPQRRKPRPRQYKIQEVIKRRQVLLVQVVKEERGNKGAALTTYLSLAGRYSVLMPNTGRGGGISRKITNPADRKRLKEIATELDVPEGMGVILRTAGANRTKMEVKRDFEYLLRLWENVRELTLRSTAPELVYEEGSLIKRSIRDLYSREIEQVVVAGEDAHREAKDFMRMLMPSHARNVQLYREDTPIFSRNGVEAQLDAMFSPQVTLKSGGYIVINQTEALVAIDVNSGRSTREHSIEDTALSTNLEAAEEIARQLRLRDLAGLIVIDFIDMEENRNNRAVERKLKDCLRADRARIQVGRISHFGLMEMSRQRIRTGVLESSTVHCPHCRGTGQVRSISSLSLQILRALEDNLLRHGAHHLLVRTRPEVALYVLNQKRQSLALLEDRFGVTITVVADTPADGAGFIVERGAVAEPRPQRAAPIAMLPPPELDDDVEDEVDDEDVDAETGRAEDDDEVRAEETGSGEGRDRKRRRRRRRGGNGEDRPERGQNAAAADDAQDVADADGDAEEADAASAEGGRGGPEDEEGRRRRRGRRGGRRRARGRDNGDTTGPEGFVAHEGFEGQDQGGDEDAEALEFPNELEFAPADASDQEAGLRSEQASGGGQGSQEQGPDWSSPQSDSALPAGSPTFDSAGAEPLNAPQAAGASADDHENPQADEPAGGPSVVAEPIAASSPATEPAREREDAATQVMERPEPVEDNRPKRMGWWNRKSFF
jgi:ribonuclease E